MKVVRLDEIEGIPAFGTLVWKPVRKTLGITAFGVNAYTASKEGDEVVEEHDELPLGHEELYVVVQGRAVFTVDGEELDAPAGTLVFLEDPAQTRYAVAREAGTTVLAIGGVPGRHEVSAWEYFYPVLPLVRAGEYGEARRLLEEGLAARPDSPTLLYNLACIEALAGEPGPALQHLTAAIEREPSLRERAQTDEDFAAIRADPRFPK